MIAIPVVHSTEEDELNPKPYTPFVIPSKLIC